MQDLFTIKRIAKTLEDRCVNAKINKVFQPSSEEVNLLLFKEKAFRLGDKKESRPYTSVGRGNRL